MSPPPHFSETDLSRASSSQSFYDILEVSPQSTQGQLRDAYWEKSKQCHPDTAVLDKVEAAQQFQELKKAYDTLRFPEKRSQYDQWLQQQKSPPKAQSPKNSQIESPNPEISFKPSSAFLRSEDRQLSAGEIFALFILGLTFLFCLLIAIFLGMSRGEMLVQSMPSDSSLMHQLESFKMTKNHSRAVEKTQPTHHLNPNDRSHKTIKPGNT